MNNSNIAFNENMLAYCGLYCEQCSFKLAHDENDMKHLRHIPYATTLGELSAYNCEGCKGYCICGVCKIKPCASEKKFASCAECDSFPCEHIEAFEHDGMPHHQTAIANLRHIRQHGLEDWFDRLKPSLQCAECGAKQSWYFSCTEHGAHR